MKKQIFVVVILCGALLASFLAVPAPAGAGVRVGIGIQLPPLIFPGPPSLVVVPGSYVYYPPSIGADIFFYRGYWYRPYRGSWYRANHYNGPWSHFAVERVPRALHRLPPQYRHARPGYEAIPYRRVRKNWRAWERDRYWDRNERGRDHGRGRSHSKSRERGWKR